MEMIYDCLDTLEMMTRESIDNAISRLQRQLRLLYAVRQALEEEEPKRSPAMTLEEIQRVFGLSSTVRTNTPQPMIPTVEPADDELQPGLSSQQQTSRRMEIAAFLYNHETTRLKDLNKALGYNAASCVYHHEWFTHDRLLGISLTPVGIAAVLEQMRINSKETSNV